MKASLGLRRAEGFLLFSGFCLTAIAASSLFRFQLFQFAFGGTTQQETNHSLAGLSGKELRSVFDPTAKSLKVAGTLEIPRIGLSVIVTEGNEDKGLELGAVRLADTSPFGTIGGNTVVVAHRDMAFWPLRKIVVGDKIRFRADRVYRYVAKSIEIVKPENVSVLDQTPDSTLTLITCYPFRFVGHAPERFVVRSQLVQ